jgi:PAS domain S-box-containing protein
MAPGTTPDCRSDSQCSKRLQALIEATPLPIVSLDLEGRVVTWSRAAERTFGWSEAETLGQILPCLPEMTPDEVEGLCRRVRSGESFRDFQARRRRKDGTFIDVSVSTAPIHDEDGRFTGMAVVYDDVTERQRTERALRASEEQLRQAQKMEAIGRLAGGVAHDFNNILTAIQSYSEILADDLGTGHASLGDVHEIQAAASRAASLTRQLLTFSRKQNPCLEVIDLNETVRETERMLRRVIGEDIELRSELAGDLARVSADASQMAQVLLNLAVNARDAMPNGGRLGITTRNVEVHHTQSHAPGLSPGGYVCLTVRDTGTGMDPITQSRIFEPFFTTKEAGKGTGLGLSMVYSFVQQSGGTIEVESQPGAGTCFTIWLPRHTSLRAWHPDPVAPRPAAPIGATIMLVEDDTMVRTIARRTLTRGGYTVLEAGSGRAAMELAARTAGSIDLVIVDTVLPGISGTEFATAFRQLRPDARILMMSGYTEEAANRVLLRDTGDAFLDKPFSSHGLLDAVARTFQQAVSS